MMGDFNARTKNYEDTVPNNEKNLEMEAPGIQPP